MRWLRRFVRRETFTLGRKAWNFLRAVLFVSGGVVLCAATGWLVRVGLDASKKAGQFSTDHWHRFLARLPDWVRVVPEGVQWWAAHLWAWLQALWSWLGFPPKPIQTLLLAFAGVVAWYLWRELRRPVLMIEPFDVPKELAETGLSPRVVASWIGTALPELKRSTIARSSSAAKVTYAHHSLPDIQIPEAKIGLRAIIEFLRDVLGWHMLRIGGDIVETGDGWTVTVYESWGRNQTWVGQESVAKGKRDELVKKATELALKAEEPFLFGVLMQSRRRSEEALRIAREMALDDPEVVYRVGKRAAKRRRIEGHLLWSYILTQQKDYEEALKHVSLALHLDRRSAHAYTNWGYVLGTRGDHRAAIEKYEKATTLDPKNTAAYFNWGCSLSELRVPDHRAAIKKYEKATTLDPRYAAAYNNWGCSLAALPVPDHRGAIEKYEKAITLDPKDAVAYCNWGNSLYAMEGYPAAIEKYEKATTLDPKNAAAYFNWGSSLYAMEEYPAAIEKYEKAITLDPKNAAAYYNCALVLVRLVRISEAKYMLKKAVEHGIKKEEIDDRLRGLLDEDHEPDEAK
jgi:tetratricopeptide (TPR) repeat protein